MTSLSPRSAASRTARRRVGKALAVVEPGDDVGGRQHRRAPLLLDPPFGFVLQVDVAPPAEQDQRDIERQRGAGDADFAARNPAPATRRLWKKALPFQISIIRQR